MHIEHRRDVRSCCLPKRCWRVRNETGSDRFARTSAAHERSPGSRMVVIAGVMDGTYRWAVKRPHRFVAGRLERPVAIHLTDEPQHRCDGDQERHDQPEQSKLHDSPSIHVLTDLNSRRAGPVFFDPVICSASSRLRFDWLPARATRNRPLEVIGFDRNQLVRVEQPPRNFDDASHF